MLTRQEAARDTIRINTRRLNRMTREDLYRLAAKHDLDGRGAMTTKAKLVRNLAPLATIEDFEPDE